MVESSNTKRPTMGDVAKLAGVSRKTVSRVYNSEPTVAEELVAKVRIAAEQLNYKMNMVASDLRRNGRRPSTIGLLIQDVSNEFSASIFRSVEDVAEQYGVTVLASNLDESEERERQLASILIARRVDGLLIVPAGLDQSYLGDDQRSGTPIVFLDRPPHLLRADIVLSSNEDGALSGVAHLIEHGHHRIAFIGETGTHEPARLRLSGYRLALQLAGIPMDPSIVRRDLQTESEAERAIIDLLTSKNPPTAVFAAHNRLTKGVVKGLRSLNIQENFALVGFDDFELAYLLQPAVTVVAQDPATIGRIGAEMLFKRIHGDTSPMNTQIVRTTLIPRGSGEIVPFSSQREVIG